MALVTRYGNDTSWGPVRALYLWWIDMIFQFKKQQYHWQFYKGFFFLCLTLFVLCCVLGVWQLKRYHYKKTLLEQFEQRAQGEPKSFLPLIASGTATEFQSVVVEGNYLNDQTMFVQGRVYQGQSGYEVLTPFRALGSDTLLLIDRGWVPQAKVPISGRSLTGTEPLYPQRVRGYLKTSNEYHFILGKNILEPDKKPLQMQKIDPEEIERITGERFYPFVLRLGPAEKDGFMRSWVISTVLPERHLGYAVQWFGLAGVLIIAFACFSLERIGGQDV